MFNLRFSVVFIFLALSACGDAAINNDTSSNSADSSEIITSSGSMESATNNQSMDTSNTSTLPTTNSVDSTENRPSSTSNQTITNVDNTANQTSNTPNQTDVVGIAADMVAAKELPSGCVGDVDSAGNMYCVYPDSRLFIASLADETTWWSFTLPGENASNEIEAVVVVDNEIVLVADKKLSLDATANDKYEISRFEKNGAFIETLNVRLASVGAVNGCQEIWCGNYVKSTLLPYPNQAAENLLAQNALTASGEPALILGWSRYHSKEYDSSLRQAVTVFEGGVISMIELNTGLTIAEHLYTAVRLESISEQINGRITVTTDQSESQLDDALMSVNSRGNTVTGFNGAPASQWLFEFNSVISANPLHNMGAEITYFETLQNWLNGSTIAGNINADALFGESVIEQPTADTTGDTSENRYSEGIIESNCEAGGTVTITSQVLLPSQQINSSRETTRNRHYQFNQCAIIVTQTADSSDTESSDAGAYLLHGELLNLQYSSNGQRSSSSRSTWQANAIQMTYPDDSIVELSGLNKISDSRNPQVFSRNISIDSEISHYSQVNNGIETKRWRDFSRKANKSTSNIVTSWRLAVQGEVFDSSLGENEIQILTDQPFNRVSYNTFSNKPSDNFEGKMTLSTDSGEQILIQPISDQESPFTREWLLVSRERNGMTSSKIIPLQLLYSPVSIDN